MKSRFENALFTIIITFFACNSTPEKKGETRVQASAEKTADSYEYDLAKPEKKWILPNELLEISGNAWIDKNHLLAIEDIHPNLYLIRLENSAVVVKRIPFNATSKEKLDVEDVTVVNNTAYALYSHGKIFKIDIWKNNPAVKEISTFLNKENNTEG